jgi:hypothetical protein
VKVVINNRYGGFGLSEEALAWLREHEWKHCARPEDAPRHDPLLVKCVEALGEKASDRYASLSIVDAGCAYRISEYDGLERIEHVSGDAITITDAEVTQAVADVVAAERAVCLEIVGKLARHAYINSYTRGRSDAAAEIAQAIASRSKGEVSR